MYCLLPFHNYTGTSVVGQFANKRNGGASNADSAIGTWTRQSVITGGSVMGVSQFSEVRCQKFNVY